jgi:hypothetical protein
VVPINIGPNPTSSYHRTTLFGGRFVHIMCTAFGRWMRTSTRPPPFIFHIFGVADAGNRAHLVLSLFFDRWRIRLAGLYRQRFTLLFGVSDGEFWWENLGFNFLENLQPGRKESLFLKADPIAIISTPPVHCLENRIKIPNCSPCSDYSI